MDFTDRTFELREIETLRGHTDVVWCVSWNPTTGVDGVPAMIASCGGEKETVIWEQNTTTGSFQFKKVLPDLETNGFIWCAWAASASVLATSSVEGCICVWKDFEETFTETEFSFLRLRNHLLVNASLCASGEFIATVVPESDIRIWKIPSEAESGRHEYTIQALALNGRGNKIIACSGNTINIWSLDVDRMRYGERLDPGTHLCTLTGYHDKTILSVHVSREEIICTGAVDGAICFFIENGERSDKLRLASASDDGTIKIWELTSTPRV